MTAYVTTAAGRTFQLPVPLSWELNYTAGVPSDSFWVRCPWQASQGTDPAEWVRFSAAEAGETVFSGVVDECEVNQGTEGLRLEVSGRGMAALLLDNEALGQDYGTATLEDILRDHVAPYGIELAGEASLPAVSPSPCPLGAASGRCSMSSHNTAAVCVPALTGQGGWCWRGGPKWKIWP